MDQPFPDRASQAAETALTVFTDFVLNAAQTCRVSSKTVGNPAASSAANSHCDSGPASRPIPATGSGRARDQARWQRAVWRRSANRAVRLWSLHG